MKILTFAASSSTHSINKKLATYAASLLNGHDIEIVDLNDYELPLFSEDKEKELGQPSLAKTFLSKISDSDALIISFAEHNGTYTAAYKNLFDWCSRINPKVFQNKSIVMLATSPGGRGASSVLSQAVSSAPHFDGDVKASLSIPNFHENFNVESGELTNNELKKELSKAVQKIL